MISWTEEEMATISDLLEDIAYAKTPFGGVPGLCCEEEDQCHTLNSESGGADYLPAPPES